MKRLLYFVLLALMPALANAFGLGNLDLNSALNEPFDARIQLLSPTADELDSLKISLADSEAFARAKIDRPFILSKLRFDLRRSVDDGPDYIRVYSQEPIREPFLNFLVEVSWSNGRLFREYTVLLDPPLYDPNARSAEFTQSTVEAAPSVSSEPVTIDDPEHLVTYSEDYENYVNKDASTTTASKPSYTPTVSHSSGDYGPTTSADTLWSIASEMRPDSSISVNKMMMALLRANPDAFIDQNINGLKRGQILRMPNESELNTLSNSEALKEAQSQYSAWGDIRENLSSNVSERPEVSSTKEVTTDEAESGTVVTEDIAEAELKLVSADETGEATDQVSSVDSGNGEGLILAQETIQVLTQENLELKDRVQESDALLSDLKRLLSLKDDELAALQEQMAMAEVEEEVSETEEIMEEATDEVAEVEEGIVETEEEILAEVEEEVAETEEEILAEVEEAVSETEEIMEEATDEVAEAEEEVIDVIETEPEPASAGVMGMVDQYLGPVKEILLGNPIIGMAVGGILLLLIIVVVVMKFRKAPAETVELDTMTEEAFPDFDSGDLGVTADDTADSKAETVLPDSEDETVTPPSEDNAADQDLDEEEQAQSVAEETPPVEEPEEEEEDPLQEVNTYLAFEQFDQAEEFVRNVINDNPDNPEYHSKLLEVFYTSGNKKSYEEEAKVLHDLVAGEGEYWNMATAMWSEMSPNRALFEAGADDEDEETDDEDKTGGFVDVTADEEASDDDAGGLDFDIGGAEEAPAEEEMLDITGSSNEDALEMTAAAEAEDLLDVTAAVNIDEEIESMSESSETSDADDILDISGTGSGAEDLLDITSADESSGDDLLDVTAAANLDLDSEEDLLDVTAATSAGADSSELLDLDTSDAELDLDVDSSVDSEVNDGSNEIEFDIGAGEEDTSEEIKDDNALDFDMSSDASDSNEIEFDIEAVDSEAETKEIELDIDEPSNELEEPAMEVDLGSAEDHEEPIRLDVEESDNEISLDMDIGGESVSTEEESLEIDLGDAASDDDMSLEIDLDDSSSEEVSEDISLDVGEDEGIELDLSIGEDEPQAEIETVSTEAESPEIDLDFSLDDEAVVEPEESSLDLDGTVELPKSALSLDEDDDDDDDHTVFVPRTAQPDEQSAEDEIATKLDLAKAYVELGDKDSAKTILDEVMAEGNDDQRKQAEDLLGQV